MVQSGEFSTKSTEFSTIAKRKVVRIMFLGQYPHSLDSKNRLFIPSKFREKLGDTFVIVQSVDHCLRVYPMNAWMQYYEEINKYPDMQAREIRRFTYSTATENELDSQGRTILTKDQKAWSFIEKDIYILGVGEYLEIWSKEAWDKSKEKDINLDLEQLMIELEKNGRI